MATLTVRQAEKNLLGIILDVECGFSTPEKAVEEQAALLEQAPEEFQAEYTLEDFQRIRDNALSTYDSDADFYEQDTVAFKDEADEL